MIWNITPDELDACLQRIDAAIRHGGINVASMLLPIAESLNKLKEPQGIPTLVEDDDLDVESNDGQEAA